jgi:allantoate deiminase
MSKEMPNRSDRLIARCRALAACTEVPGETTRTFLSEPMHAVHDAVVYAGANEAAPRLVIA